MDCIEVLAHNTLWGLSHRRLGFQDKKPWRRKIGNIGKYFNNFSNEVHHPAGVISLYG